MFKKLILILALSCISLHSQSQNVQWGNTINCDYTDYISDLKIDRDGNTIICGWFRKTVDFDPGPDSAKLTSASVLGQDIFLAKYDSNGNYLWAHNFGNAFFNDEGDRIATDTAGNIFMTGFFSGTSDFDPDTIAVYNISGSNSSRSRFLVKYNKDGNFIAGKFIGNAVGSLPSSQDGQTGLACDYFGNVYVSGFFGTTLALDPQPGGTLSVSGLSDNYFAKYDDSLNFKWGYRIGSTGTEYSQGINVTDSGIVMVLGSFSNTVDFDPGINTAYLNQTGNTNDGYFAEYDSAGNFIFVKHLAPGGSCSPIAISWDSKKNILITGSCTAMLDADPGIDTALIGSGYNDQVFLAAYDSVGNYRWAFAYGDENAYQAGYGVSFDSSDNIYVNGFYQPFVDIDPGPDTATFGNRFGGFVARYDTGGIFMSGFYMPESRNRMRIHEQAMFMTAGYYGLYDFDPGPGVYNMMSDTANASWYIVKLNICDSFAASPGTINVPQSICAGDTIIINISKSNEPYEWIFTTGLTPLGNTTSDSIYVAVDTSFFDGVITCQSIGGCLNSVITYLNISANHAIIPTITQIPDTLFTTDTAIAYQWFLNGNFISGADSSLIVPAVSGLYSVMTTDSNGCTAMSLPYNFVNAGIENSLTESFTINYPNPFEDFLFIETSTENKITSVSLKDMNGKTVINNTESANKIILQTKNLTPGVYILEWNVNGVVARKRVLKF